MEFLFFFLSLLGFHKVGRRIHVLFQIRPRLIIVSFLVDKSFLWYSFNEATIPRSLSSFKGEAFSFLCSLRGIILEFGFLPYLKLCSWFFNEQRQLLMRLHPVMNERQLTYFRSLKNYNVLTYGVFSPQYQSLSLTRTWLIESQVLPCLSHLVMIEKVGEWYSLSHGHFCLLLSPPDSQRARGVMVIIVGNGHGDTSSNPGPD